ncbi:MAG: hypothetical protein RLZZ528_2109 [Pseudomonadota bacterium]|jgi:uncharacterized protein YjiS (DUF1127 family)
MAYVSSVLPRLSLSERVTAFLGDFREERARRALYLRTLGELRSMSARDLADIGIDAGQIEDIAHAHAYGR